MALFLQPRLHWVAIIGLALGTATAGAEAPADLVLKNGAVYTMSATRRVAEALAIRGSRIVYVGTSGGTAPLIGPVTAVVDLRGKMVLPGFQDAHVHPLHGGRSMRECDQHLATTSAEAVEMVRRYAAQNPQLSWIRGEGWALPLFPKANPHKSLLDKVVPDRPVYLVAADGHSAWVNSRALQLAGISSKTPDPPNGRIERDPQTGEPSGTLREDAMSLVARHLPTATPAQQQESLKLGIAEANRYGITALQDASVDETILKAYQELDQRGDLTVRVRAGMTADASNLATLPKLKEWRQQYRGRRLQAGTIKIFEDGVIEAKTAALLEPYLNSKGERGVPRYPAEALNAFVTAADKEQFQIHVHAIGDRAIRMALDAFEQARRVNGSRDSRHHIAHLELIDPHDIPRFQSLRVAANFQPLWAFADPYIKDLTVPILGPERSRWLYPIRSVQQTGALLVAGSDWPVSSINPLEAIQVALTRRDPEHPQEASWIPEETVGLSEMLAAYTINAAFVNFLDDQTGSLEMGKRADCIVLDRDLFAVPAQEISKSKILWTILDGREVYRAPAFSAPKLPARTPAPNQVGD